MDPVPVTERDPVVEPNAMRDLGPRLLSGVLLGAVALALTWAAVWTFALLVLAVSLIVAWEWGRVVRAGGVDAIFMIHAVFVVAAVGLTYGGVPALAVVGLMIGAILATLLGFESGGRLSALGVLYAGLPAVALIWLRGSTPLGLEVALFILLVVIATDTGAYAAGRSVGGPRLMPSISPNKTWSGLIGGVSAGTIVAIGFAHVTALGFGRLAVAGAALAAISQAGDLMESALKRRHQVKDSSGLIPGHGGFMDRVDGLIVAAIAAGVIGAIVDFRSPASGILGWR
jgi:phosphatidate cytidylyltransferase